MAVLGENGGSRNQNLRFRTLDFGFVTPKRHFLARNRVVQDVFCVKIGARVSAVAFLKNPPPQKKVAESLCAEGREITHAQNRNL